MVYALHMDSDYQCLRYRAGHSGDVFSRHSNGITFEKSCGACIYDDRVRTVRS